MSGFTGLRHYLVPFVFRGDHPKVPKTSGVPGFTIFMGTFGHIYCVFVCVGQV